MVSMKTFRTFFCQGDLHYKQIIKEIKLYTSVRDLDLVDRATCINFIGWCVI